jgi:hypothetical protein
MTRPSLRRSIPAPLKSLYRDLEGACRGTVVHVRNVIATPNDAPILVLGNQKSGTSAVAALLGALTDQSVQIDLMRANRSGDFQRVHSGSLSFSSFLSRYRWEFSRAIVKEPNFVVIHEELRAAFPGAHLVFVVRDPRSNIRSILDRLALPGDLADLPSGLEERIPETWRSVLDGYWLGLDGGNYVERLARRWVYAASVQEAAADDMLVIRYEDFVEDKLRVLSDLAAELGLRRENDISGKLDRQYQPAGGNRNMGFVEFFGSTNLQKIESICRRDMARFGYDVGVLDPGS